MGLVVAAGFGAIALTAFARVAAASADAVHRTEATAAEGERHEFEHAAMGTRFRIVVHGPGESARRAAEAAFARVDAIEAALSDYRADSELRRLERAAASGPVAVGPDLLAVLTEAMSLSAATDGAFDPTVGALTRLWRWAARRGIDPPADRLAEARETVGYAAIRIDTDRGTVALTRPGVRLDLGGIAKGWAIDAAFGILEARGLSAVLVDGGGDLRLGRAPPGTDGWRIAVPHDGPDGAGWRTATLAEVAVATSGGTFRAAGVPTDRRSHILDPRTGRGVPAARTATVLAETAMRADGLASALAVLGPEGLQTVRALGARDARLIEPGRS